jgi:hypothetical protein
VTRRRYVQPTGDEDELNVVDRAIVRVLARSIAAEIRAEQRAALADDDGNQAPDEHTDPIAERPGEEDTRVDTRTPWRSTGKVKSRRG